MLDELLAGALTPGRDQRDGVEPAEARRRPRREPTRRDRLRVERDGGRLRAMHLRTGSYANWPAVAHATAGNLLPDFPLINKSFELCYACADR